VRNGPVKISGVSRGAFHVKADTRVRNVVKSAAIRRSAVRSNRPKPALAGRHFPGTASEFRRKMALNEELTAV
jgi:hypothetical protein